MSSKINEFLILLSRGSADICKKQHILNISIFKRCIIVVVLFSSLVLVSKISEDFFLFFNLQVVDVTLLFKTGQHTKEVTSQYIVPTVQYETCEYGREG